MSAPAQSAQSAPSVDQHSETVTDNTLATGEDLRLTEARTHAHPARTVETEAVTLNFKEGWLKSCQDVIFSAMTAEGIFSQSATKGRDTIPAAVEKFLTSSRGIRFELLRLADQEGSKLQKIEYRQLVPGPLAQRSSEEPFKRDLGFVLLTVDKEDKDDEEDEDDEDDEEDEDDEGNEDVEEELEYYTRQFVIGVQWDSMRQTWTVTPGSPSSFELHNSSGFLVGPADEDEKANESDSKPDSAIRQDDQAESEE